MGPAVLLIMFGIGWSCDSWKWGFPTLPFVAALLTALCFFTTNNPVFTSVERDLSFTASSIALNFVVKLGYVTLCYTAGFALKTIIERLRGQRN